MVSSLQLKTAALGWLRYGKRLMVVCTEVGRWNADVLGLSPDTAFEVEVKTSMADLRREFKEKLAKHYLYANAKDTSHVPNHFSFLVHKDMAEAAVDLVAKEAPKAGVAVYDQDCDPLGRGAVTVLKRAAKLKATPPSEQLWLSAIMRASSELANLYKYNVDFIRTLETKMTKSCEDMAVLAARAAGTLDFEHGSTELDLRARELAMAVDGVEAQQWLALAPEAKERWLMAAARLLDAQFVAKGGWLNEPLQLQ